jgi:hypothetical protein
MTHFIKAFEMYGNKNKNKNQVTISMENNKGASGNIDWDRKSEFESRLCLARQALHHLSCTPHAEAG